jgi:curved DNA-binding protein
MDQGALGASLSYYDRLQVSPSADIAVITAAFGALAQRYQPDQPTSAPLRLAELAEAFRVLTDPESRARYDAARRRPVPSRGLRRRLAGRTAL